MNLKTQFKTGAFGHLKHSILPLERMQCKVFYAFSLSPGPSIQNFENPLRFKQCLEKTLEKLKRSNILISADIELYPEISTKSQNIHFHGYISFKKPYDIVNFYLYLHMLDEDFSYEIDTIKDFNWYVYITKCRYLMEPYCKYLKLPYKIHNKTKICNPLDC